MTLDHARDFASRKNLIDALTERKLDTCRFLVVRNEQGRWTAIFPASSLQNGMARVVAENGFMVLG